MLIVAFVCTVALLICMGFFLMGSLPLLVLQHDTPLDARFIRGFFNVYYAVLAVTGTVGAMSYAIAGRFGTASLVACIGIVGIGGRLRVIERMDALRRTMTADDRAGIARFRRLHVLGMVLNALVLAALCVGMTRLSM